MKKRHSQFDVSNTINVTSTAAVCEAVCDIFKSCYVNKDSSHIRQAFDIFENLFEGHYKGYQSCDTYYHDKQHTLDVTLAFARLLHGHEKQSPQAAQFNTTYFSIGIITSLFHDAGYIRKQHDQKHYNGAQYTRTHVSRSASFLREYLIKNNLGQFADTAATMVHYTGYEFPLHKIKLADIKFHVIGYMIGTADLISQMADRCYLEKCRDRLFPEFVLAGLTEIKKENGDSHILFANANDLLIHTPEFYRKDVLQRLNQHFQNVHRYAQVHFDGEDLYMQSIEKNIQHIESLIENKQLSSLLRLPPQNLASKTLAYYNQQQNKA